MTDLNDISAFLEVARAGGFGAAAKAIGVPKSSLSRRVAHLEKALGVSLFKRTTRMLVLTAAGERYLDACSRILSDLTAANQVARAEQDLPEGVVRLTAPVGFGRVVLSPLLARFSDMYPKITQELMWSDELVDILGGQYDIALRSGALSDSSFIARKLRTGRFMMYASPNLARKLALQTPADLAGAPTITFRLWGDTWSLSQVSRKKTYIATLRPKIVCTDMASIQRLAVCGAGIALLPEFEAQLEVEAGRLIPVLPDWGIIGRPFHMIYTAQKFVPKRVRLLIDFLLDELADNK